MNMREVAEALGFEPDNHHNAAVCPYCTDNGQWVTVRRDDLRAVVEGGAPDQAALDAAVGRLKELLA